MNVTQTITSRPEERADPLIDFRRLYYLLRERVWLIACCTIALCLLGGIYLWLAPGTYASRGTIMVEQQETRVVNIQDVTQDDLKSLEMMKTVEQSLTTDALILRVAKINQLATNPNFLPQRQGEGYSDDELIRALTDCVKARVRRGTRLIDITVESRDPALAKQLAQSFIGEFILQGYEQRISVAREANGFLVQEAGRLKTKLEKSEREIQAYREQNNAVSLEDKQNIVVETLKDLNLKLNDARTQRMKLESDFAQYKALANGDPRALLVLSSIADSPTVLEAKKRVAEQEAQIAMLTHRYRAEHPKFMAAQSELAQLTADLNKTILKAGEAIGSGYEVAAVNEHKLEEALRAQEKLSLELNKIAIPYSGLGREVEADRTLYQSILTRLKETDVTKALEKSPIRVIEPARVPTQPVRPNKVLILLSSLFGGLGLGVCASLLLQGIDSSLKSVDETERALGLPVIATVPVLERLKSLGIDRALPILNEPDSPVAEAFRSLRTVLTLKASAGRQVLLCTSAAPGEGKTFCSLNCALALAQQGHRTLLLDADLRRPAIAKALQLSPQQPGLTDYLSGAQRLADLIRENESENLSVLASGPAIRNPAELFSVATIERLFNDPLLASFDRVVVDSAPIHAVSDALSLVRHVSVICLVVRAAVTPARVVQRAVATLAAAGAGEMAVVLNALPAGGRDSYYYYSTEYARRAEGATEHCATA